MSMTINGYVGHPLGISLYGKCVYELHIERARRWLFRELSNSSPDSSMDVCPVKKDRVEFWFPNMYKGQPNPDDLTNPTMIEDGKKKVTYPLKHLNSSFRKWENHLGISSSTYQITYETHPSKFASANGRVKWPKIYLSGYCAALAVLRAGIMHEVYEMRVGSKYAYYDISFGHRSGPCHQMAERREAKIRFEEPSETMVRMVNLTSCLEDMGRITDEVMKQKGRDDMLCKNCRAIMISIKQLGVIPGYCEIYERKAYRNPHYSQIGKFFEKAGRRGIRFPS